MKKFAQVE